VINARAFLIYWGARARAVPQKSTPMTIWTTDVPID